MDDRGALSLRVFALYRDSELRREALAAPLGNPARYCLFGLDELRDAGIDVAHNLAPGTAPSRATRAAADGFNRLLRNVGGYGGDFASVLACRREIARADVVFSTVDTLGIPLALLRSSRAVARVPVVYVSVALLDRIGRLRGERMHRRYREAIGSVAAVVAYGHAEAEELRRWLEPLPSPPPVVFVPFGVDTEAFVPVSRRPDVDVVSVGADPNRDFDALVRLARRMPGVTCRIVTTPDQAAVLGQAPNVAVETGVPFHAIAHRLASGRVVVLPVHENSYSGATTTLLQAMAMARPIVVTRTAAIGEGYGFVDGEHCRLVPPGDDEALARAVAELLAAPEAETSALGARARQHVASSLSWRRYVHRMRDVIVESAGQATR